MGDETVHGPDGDDGGPLADLLRQVSSPEQRRVLRLRYEEGWPLARIAETMEVSPIEVTEWLVAGLRAISPPADDRES